MRLVPVGERRRLVGLGFAGAVVGHGLTVAVLARGAGGHAAVDATGHQYWASCGAAAVGAAVAAVVTMLVGSGLAHVRATRQRVGHPLSVTRAFGWLAVVQLGAFAVTELLERAAAHDGLVSVVDHRVLLPGLVIQMVIAFLAAQALRLVRRVAEVFLACTSAEHFARCPGCWLASRHVDGASAAVARFAASRAPPSLA
jgi:hypothetical protein